jgi:hypothetical protein
VARDRKLRVDIPALSLYGKYI